MVTYNRLDLTKQTVEGLKKSVDIDYKFIIIDNNSTDGTVEYLKELNPSVLILNNTNQGIAKARNQCLKAANAIGTEYYCFVDNDVRMPVGWLSECIEILKANKSYGMLGVNMEGQGYPIVESKGFKFQSKPQGNLGTACVVFPLSTHKLLGFFNTMDYSPFYGLEDTDFGMRARFAGLKLGYIERMGEHLGVGTEDVGEYREFKTKEHDSYIKVFRDNCNLYANRKKPLYVKEQDGSIS